MIMMILLLTINCIIIYYIINIIYAVDVKTVIIKKIDANGYEA